MILLFLDTTSDSIRLGAYMPRKKKRSTRTILIIVVLIAVAGVTVVAWHDGLIMTTPLGEINNLNVSSGAVRVRGEITAISGTTITLHDGTGTVLFEWAGPATLNSIVVVTGSVSSAHFLHQVSSVEPVWLFR